MKVFICMDDEDCIEKLSELLYQTHMEEDISIDSYDQFVNIAFLRQRESYDVAFIGDRIHGDNGFLMGEYLHDANPECLIIYIGDDYAHMHESFRAYGYQMFLKQELPELFNGEFQRIWSHYQKLHHEEIFYLDNGGTRRFLPGEIVYIEN